jgi:hypothetical protein
VLTTIEEPARGPAADEGVRPTIDADGRNWENYVALVCIGWPLYRSAPKAAGASSRQPEKMVQVEIRIVFGP